MNFTTQTKTLVVITGPTAVGKTELCVKVAQHFNTEIISADSRQFYKELAIGTAKPSTEEMQNITHHFIDSHSITEDYNVNDFEKDALATLAKLFQKHQIVILTGGSGLYIDALCDGFDEEVPGSNQKIRTELEKLYQQYGIETLQEKLKQLDPVFYTKVDLKNVKRLQRAIEVCMLTGKKYSNIRKGNKQNRPFKILKIGLNREREELFDRINLRVDLMMEQGLLDEVKSVVKHKDKNALKTVGYTELFDFLNDNITLEEATEKIKVNSRRYAKRQIGWFKKTDDYTWFHPKNKEEIIDYISLELK
ncbi:MAG: tRNA (adenosine(37)-N6)-dimethylallyltransferase MiaA [Flavobacteriales bacterium]|nr:MAG: tRNA (adenosine(37)-N6)-dimethylallyltransferase MiaA [Flavobacteriales bacterium]